MQFWLVKTEPDVYSWTDLVKDKKTFWDGVRNYAARNHMQAMKRNDLVIVYHSGDERSAVGLSTVVKEAYQDPTTEDERWVCVDLKADKAFKKPVTLAQVKADKVLVNSALVRIGRLSVLPLTEAEFNRFMELSS